ncbi:hypothetical protein L9F63_001979, partial [Diploptera punctata]
WCGILIYVDNLNFPPKNKHIPESAGSLQLFDLLNDISLLHVNEENFYILERSLLLLLLLCVIQSLPLPRIMNISVFGYSFLWVGLVSYGMAVTFNIDSNRTEKESLKIIQVCENYLEKTNELNFFRCHFECNNNNMFKDNIIY